LKLNNDFSKLYESDDQVKDLIDKCMRLEGIPRHTSMHAAGVVICQKSVDEYVPLSRGSEGTLVSQFTMNTLEELGLLKMDFLGLRTLTVIQNAERLVKKLNPDFTINDIDYEQKKVFDLISSGRTEGIFQLESAGMKSFMKELKPQNIEDIIAGISLYRPGPMDFIPKYIKGKNDKASIVYDCPQLEPILKPTYGCIVYQEQVMQIVRDLAGYTLGRSDLLRRAMSKKKAYVMEKERKNFIFGNEEEGVKGCINNGIDEKIAGKIFEDMIDFAKYAFNKSHAACYAVVSYQTAYMKANYSNEFMAALMTSVIDNTSKVAEYILSCRQMNIKILPPDINEGEYAFSVSGDSIRYGLSAIKSIGRPTIDALVSERDKNGLYKNLKDFIERMNGEVNKRTIESLIKAGAFDGFGANRRQMMLIYVAIMDNVSREKKNLISGQMSLFDFVDQDSKSEFDIKMPEISEFTKEEILTFEKEVLGVYLSGHPLDAYEGMWRRHISATTADFEVEEDSDEIKISDGQKVIIGGMIVDKTIKNTKNGQMMAFVTIEDLLGTVEVIIFPRDFVNNKSLLEVDNKVFITGRVTANADEKGKVICEKVVVFDDIPRKCWIRFKNIAEYKLKEAELLTLIQDSDGIDQVIIYCVEEKLQKPLSKSKTIFINEQLINILKNQFGNENVQIT